MTLIEHTPDGSSAPAVFHGATFVLKVNGDSMAPIFCDGDLVYFAETDNVASGEIAAVVWNDAATIKRVYIQGECACLCSSNPQYPPMRMMPEDFRIIGKAVGMVRALV